MLEQHECRDRDEEDGHADHHHRRDGERAVVGRAHQQQSHARQYEHQLGRHADRGVDHHARGRRGARHSAQMDEAHAGDIAADARNRQQRVDGFTDPADPDDGEGMRTRGSGQQLPPRQRAEGQRDKVEQGYRDEPPAHHQHRMSHLRSTAVDDQIDDQQEPERTGDDQRKRDDLSPSGDAFRALNMGPELAAPTLPAARRRLLSPFPGRSN